MAQEPTQLAPRVRWQRPVKFLLSAAASVAAIAVVVTIAFTDNPLRPQTEIAKSEIAKTEIPPATPIVQAAALPQPVSAANQSRMNEYLMAHQEYSPSTALQGVAPYVRTVSVAHDTNSR
jgi:sigma-E factor negative regulatory protein RseA